MRESEDFVLKEKKGNLEVWKVEVGGGTGGRGPGDWRPDVGGAKE